MGLRIIDRGYKALIGAFTGKRRTEVTIGIHAADGKAPHTGSKFGETVLDIATAHEFGLGVPQRSFLRAWFDENRQQINEAIKRMALSVLKGKRTRKQAIELLAQSFVGQIQKRIAAGIPPPNSPATIAAKGSSKPLIDTGQLRTSITYAVDGHLKKSKAGLKREKANQKQRKKALKKLYRAAIKRIRAKLKVKKRRTRKKA